MAKRILVVDDDVAFAEMLQIALSSAGYDVEICLEALAALSTIRRYRPDLITLDVLMPGRSGWQIAREVWNDEHLGEIPVIVMTGLRGRREADEPPSSRRGPHQILLKPFDLDDLYRTVAQLIG